MNEKYITITQSEFESRFPKIENYNISDFPSELREPFLNLYSFYYNVLLKYLIERLQLKAYDNYFKSSELDYVKVAVDDMDVYQKLSSPDLDYFYLRNNLNIHRLDQVELQILGEQLVNYDGNLNDELIELIEKTFDKVIAERRDGIESDMVVNFGPPSPQYYASANSLVIGFRYNEYDNEQIQRFGEDQWDENHEKKLNDIDMKLYEITQQCKGAVSVPVTFIQYNDFSIKKIDNSRKVMNAR